MMEGQCLVIIIVAMGTFSSQPLFSYLQSRIKMAGTLIKVGWPSPALQACRECTSRKGYGSREEAPGAAYFRVKLSTVAGCQCR